MTQATRGMDGGQIETMTEQQLTHEDKRHKTLTLSDRLDRVSIKKIKEVSNKLRDCEPKP